MRTLIENHPVVAGLLAQLERLNFESNPLNCVDKLLVLTNLAVCKKERKAIREKVDNLQKQRQIERPRDEKGFYKYLTFFLPFRSSELAKTTVESRGGREEKQKLGFVRIQLGRQRRLLGRGRKIGCEIMICATNICTSTSDLYSFIL